MASVGHRSIRMCSIVGPRAYPKGTCLTHLLALLIGTTYGGSVGGPPRPLVGPHATGEDSYSGSGRSDTSDHGEEEEKRGLVHHCYRLFESTGEHRNTPALLRASFLGACRTHDVRVTLLRGPPRGPCRRGTGNNSEHLVSRISHIRHAC